jgi:hypothetical protein
MVGVFHKFLPTCVVLVVAENSYYTSVVTYNEFTDFMRVPSETVTT